MVTRGRDWWQVAGRPTGLVRSIRRCRVGPSLSPVSSPRRWDEETVLFEARDAPWAAPAPFGYVTDGPWVHRLSDGSLVMLWSNQGYRKPYITGAATAANGSITGPWTQLCLPFYDDEGGHPMLFETFDGDPTAAFHGPNSGDTRVILAQVLESEGALTLDAEVTGRIVSDEPCRPPVPASDAGD